MKARFVSKGGWEKTFAFLSKAVAEEYYAPLKHKEAAVVASLEHYTPKDSGETAKSWYCDTDIYHGGAVMNVGNTNVINGFNVAVGLQYGHGTGTGGYVQGRDYINPAVKEPFDDAVEAVWKEVTE